MSDPKKDDDTHALVEREVLEAVERRLAAAVDSDLLLVRALARGRAHADIMRNKLERPQREQIHDHARVCGDALGAIAEAVSRYAGSYVMLTGRQVAQDPALANDMQAIILGLRGLLHGPLAGTDRGTAIEAVAELLTAAGFSLPN